MNLPRHVTGWSRAAALAVAAGALCLGVGSLVSAQELDTGVAVRLDAPGTALQTAERLALRLPPAPDPATTPERVPPPAPEGLLLFPVDPGSDCYVLDNFGDSRGTRSHEGLDIMGSSGHAVYAVASGTLTKRYTNTGTAGWGWTLYDAETETTYKYFHLTEDPNGLVEGDTVELGDVIGFVGSSGTSSAENIHLHFELRPGNVAVDPLPKLFVDTSVCRVSPPIR
jgi:murein DD-endopeptidase MepM/ murein hydrolase activator NlpD